jgi:hypothetical protein
MNAATLALILENVPALITFGAWVVENVQDLKDAGFDPPTLEAYKAKAAKVAEAAPKETE